MKTVFNIKKQIAGLIAIAFIFTLSTTSTAQENKTGNSKNFKIIIEKTKNGVKLKCLKGCAWTDLSFSLRNGYQQPVDENGMAETDILSSNKYQDPNFAHFLFTIGKTKDGIQIKGLKGTDWSGLSFSLRDNEKQAIDKHGMAQ